MNKTIQKGINIYVENVFGSWNDFYILWALLGRHLALWGRPLVHCGLQMGALGSSLGSFGGSQGPLGVDLGLLGRLLVPKWSKLDAKMMIWADFWCQHGPKWYKKWSKKGSPWAGGTPEGIKLFVFLNPGNGGGVCRLGRYILIWINSSGYYIVPALEISLSPSLRAIINNSIPPPPPWLGELISWGEQHFVLSNFKRSLLALLLITFDAVKRDSTPKSPILNLQVVLKRLNNEKHKNTKHQNSEDPKRLPQRAEAKP